MSIDNTNSEDYEDFDLEPCPKCESEATGEAYGEYECFQCNYKWISHAE